MAAAAANEDSNSAVATLPDMIILVFTIFTMCPHNAIDVPSLDKPARRR